MSNSARKFPWIWYAIALAVLLAATLFPVPMLVYVAWFANAHGCTVNEGRPEPCMVDGVDWGGTLYSLGMSGWLLIATIPILFLGLAILGVILLIHTAIRNRRNKAV